jgi:hypothetical protein
VEVDCEGHRVEVSLADRMLALAREARERTTAEAQTEVARQLGRYLADRALGDPFATDMFLTASSHIAGRRQCSLPNMSSALTEEHNAQESTDDLPPFMYEDPDDGTIRVLC